MFASNFLEPVTKYIKDKDGKELPIRQLNRCGMIVYFLCVAITLSIFISQLTLSAFQTETITIESNINKSKNCT